MLAVVYFLIPGLLLSQLAAGNSVDFDDVLAGLGYCAADEDEPWGYRGRKGPEFWGNDHPGCNDKEQSPVDINKITVVKDETLEKLLMKNYDMPVTKANIKNNGHTVQLTPLDGVKRSITIGGSTYTLRQLHFHWGSTSQCGAEHTLNGIQHPLEMHLVHMNENEKIAVVGVMFQDSQTENVELNYIIDALPEVMHKDKEINLDGYLDLNELLPENPASYYRYQGSLTTPGCTEGVTWSVLTDLLTVTETQMEEFRQLYSASEYEADDNCRISDNYRPIQPLNHREVYVSQ